jgi:hypothetical protein
VTGLAARIAERAAGNPFFAEEMVRDLAERGVLDGDRGAYLCRDDAADISVPGTLQATIAARVDRIGRPAKQLLYAASVIGARFRPELLAALLGDTEGSEAIAELLQVELIDQVMFTPHAEYAFRHPLIRAVAYESQLKSGRAELHRRLAVVIEQQEPDSVDENAALIAENLEAAGDLRAASAGTCAPGAGWSSATFARPARAGSGPARSPTGYRPTPQIGRRCGLRPAPSYAAPPGEPVAASPTPASTNCEICAQRLTTKCRWRSAWPGSSSR